MKFYLFFVIIVICPGVKLQNSKWNLIQTAFMNISKDVAKRNHFLQITVRGVFDNTIQSAIISTVTIPHTVVRFEKISELFELESSSIVLLDTMDSLVKFINHDSLFARLSTSQQLIVYVQGGTFDELAQLNFRKQHTHLEYFVIEQETVIRLLTIVGFTKKKCKEAQLVEVNRFDKLM